MLTRIRNLNESLPELIVGIFIWGIVCQLVGVWFVQDKLGCSIGLWIGIVTAIGMAVHMAWSLNKALDFDEKSATNIMTKNNLLRYGAVLVVEGVVILTGVIHPLTTFLGIMGLKVAAYMTPITHKFFRR